jgi:hypothetical protein
MMRRELRVTGDGLVMAGVSTVMLGSVALALGCLAAWATHVVWIIKVLASSTAPTIGQIALGAIGAFMPPVGVIHGLMIWFGVGF